MTIINELFDSIPGMDIDSSIDNVVKMTFKARDGSTRSFTLTGAVITEAFTVDEYLLALVEQGKPAILMRLGSEPGKSESDLAKFLIEYAQTPMYQIKQPIPLNVREYDVLNGKLIAQIMGSDKAIVFVSGPSWQFSTTMH